MACSTRRALRVTSGVLTKPRSLRRERPHAGRHIGAAPVLWRIARWPLTQRRRRLKIPDFEPYDSLATAFRSPEGWTRGKNMQAVRLLSGIFGLLITTSAFAEDVCNGTDARFAAYKHWYNELYAKKSKAAELTEPGNLKVQSISSPGNVHVSVSRTNLGKPLAFTWIVNKNDDVIDFMLSREGSNTLGFTISLCAYAADTNKAPPTGTSVPDTTYFRSVFAQSLDFAGGRHHPLKAILSFPVDVLGAMVGAPASGGSTRGRIADSKPVLPGNVAGDVVYAAILMPQSKIRTFEGSLFVLSKSAVCAKLEASPQSPQARLTGESDSDYGRRPDLTLEAYYAKLKSSGCRK